jgi:uroporphyrinogen-III synthase
MTSSLQGRTVALAESRQLDELTRLLEKEGARPLPCPLVSILDAPDRGAVVAWLRELAAGRFAWIIFMTGEAWRRLLPIAEQEGMRDAVLAGLRATRIVCRGPKPVAALREVGLTPHLTVQPPTTEGVIAALHRKELHGQTVGLTLYGQANEPLEEFLEGAGAIVRPVLSYVYAPAADEDRVADLIHQLDAGTVDALIFTSSPQVERLFEVAMERSLKTELERGLARTRVAAVGPVVAECLHQHGVAVGVCPEQGFVMKNLVSLLRRSLSGA